ncbi:MAG TPA: VOC family protein [Candidatus Eisenbacteria bacterium]|nr:VOC family protein [Candidatus Eisenbacteria bacterium]
MESAHVTSVIAIQLEHVRHGIGTVRPYLYGPSALLDWVKQTFFAEVLERTQAGGGEHVELKIGDSVVVLETADPPPPSGAPASVYVYVEDVDATFKRALGGGAQPLASPEDRPYQERGAGVKDSFGNTWWIATYTGTKPQVNKLVPE